MSEVERLRAELNKRRKAVANKISRIKRQTGANVAGSEFDPRRAPGTENRMRSPERMRQYLSEMNDFMRRGNQFVGGAKGAPLPRGEFNRYKQVEESVKNAGQRFVTGLGNVPSPLGMTPAQLKATMPSTHGSAAMGPYPEFNREASNFKSAKSLRIITDALQNKLKTGYMPIQRNLSKSQLEKTLLAIGEVDELRMVQNLSDYQFDVLWHGTTYAEITFLRYGMEKSGANDDDTNKEKWQNKVIESATDDAREFIQYAASLPANGPASREATEKIKGFRR